MSLYRSSAIGDLIEAGFGDTPALAVARARNIPIVTLVPGNRAGDFRLNGKPASEPATTGFAQENDIALILHTSGTTSRPKMVPLAHINVTAVSMPGRRKEQRD